VPIDFEIAKKRKIPDAGSISVDYQSIGSRFNCIDVLLFKRCNNTMLSEKCRSSFFVAEK